MHSYTKNIKLIREPCSHNILHGFLVHMFLNTLSELNLLYLKLFDYFCLQWYLTNIINATLLPMLHISSLWWWNTSDSALRSFVQGYFWHERDRKLTESAKPLFFLILVFLIKPNHFYFQYTKHISESSKSSSFKKTKLDFIALYIGI